MGFLKKFWVWFTGLFNRETFEEVPEPSVVPEVEVVETPQTPPPRPAEEVLVDPPHFTPEPDVPDPIGLPEDYIFACSDGTPVPPEFWGNASLLASNLRVLAQELGKPLVLISVYRSKVYNKWVGGKEGSLHVFGRAVDFTIVDMAPAIIANKIDELMVAGKMSPGILFCGGNYIHYSI